MTTACSGHRWCRTGTPAAGTRRQVLTSSLLTTRPPMECGRISGTKWLNPAQILILGGAPPTDAGCLSYTRTDWYESQQHPGNGVVTDAANTWFVSLLFQKSYNVDGVNAINVAVNS